MTTNIENNASAHRIIHAHDLPSAQRVQAETTEGGNGALVSPPEYVSVSGTVELLQMVLELSHDDRKNKKEMQRAADSAATAAEKTQVAELRAEADARLTAAITSGFVAIGASAASFVASEASLHGGNLKADAAAAAKAGHEAAATKLAKNAAGWSAMGDRLGNGAAVLKETAKPIEGAISHGAAEHSVKAKESEHRANALRRSAESLKSDIDNIRQHDSKLFDLVREVESSMNRCTQIALQSR